MSPENIESLQIYLLIYLLITCGFVWFGICAYLSERGLYTYNQSITIYLHILNHYNVYTVMMFHSTIFL